MARKIETDPIEQADAERIGGQAEKTLAQADEARMQEMRRMAVMERITSDLPSDAESLWLITEQGLGRICMDIVLVGRALIRLKESLQHGEFIDGLKARGIPPRTAQRMMLVAKRFADRSERLLKLSRSKLYAIAEMLDDESLDKLENGEDVLGITLDDAERMTAQELREQLKRLEADIGIKDKLLEEAHKQRDEIATELERMRGEITRPEDDPRLEQIREAAMRAQAALVDLHAMAQQVSEDDLHIAGKLHAEFEEMRALFAAARETILTRFPALHMAMDDASTEAWHGQTIDAETIQ